MKNKILLLSATDYEHDCKDLFGIPIYITGIGKINAAINTTKLIHEHDPDIVINFGSCGNLKDYKIGEVLEVGTAVNDFEMEPILYLVSFVALILFSISAKPIEFV